MVKQFADDYFDANKAKIFVLSVSTLPFKERKKVKGYKITRFCTILPYLFAAVMVILRSDKQSQTKKSN